MGMETWSKSAEKAKTGHIEGARREELDEIAQSLKMDTEDLNSLRKHELGDGRILIGGKVNDVDVAVRLEKDGTYTATLDGVDLYSEQDQGRCKEMFDRLNSGILARDGLNARAKSETIGAIDAVNRDDEQVKDMLVAKILGK
jgi:hypothetical protein